MLVCIWGGSKKMIDKKVSRAMSGNAAFRLEVVTTYHTFQQSSYILYCCY